MKILYKILLMGAVFNVSVANVYFWQAERDGEFSCCLFLNGVDICNPYQACTRNSTYDLNGIFDYVSRLLVVDKDQVFSYHRALNQAQSFIRHALASRMNMYYRYDEPARQVKFYHEIAEITKSNEKASKGVATPNAALEKQKNEDALVAYLIKMGLAWPIK